MLGGLVVSMARIGRDRRNASPEECTSWTEENNGGERRGHGSSWLHLLPKTVLVALVLMLSTGLGWLSKGWVDHVNKHIDASAEGFSRLGKVEGLATTTSSEVLIIKSELSEMRAVQYEQYKTQLEHYKWMAQLEGDRRRTAEIEDKLSGLKRK